MNPDSRSPELRFIDVGGAAANHGTSRRMAWWDWSASDRADPHRTVICVHGLSRQGRDFDVLARALTEQSRVVAVDVAGRGYSDWLADPAAYQVPTYAADVAALMQHLRSQDPELSIDWVGTSMGGLIGMALAAQPAFALRRLVLNDVGPVIRWEALQRIAGYLGLNPSFSSELEAAEHLRSISAGFGPHTAAEWMALSEPMLRERDGRFWLHYDPSLALPIRALVGMEPSAAAQTVAAGEAALWAAYDAITARTLLLRGAESDLLTQDTAAEMGRRGPKAACVEFAGVGHAPTLMAPDQVTAVCNFLAAP